MVHGEERIQLYFPYTTCGMKCLCFFSFIMHPLSHFTSSFLLLNFQSFYLFIRKCSYCDVNFWFMGVWQIIGISIIFFLLGALLNYFYYIPKIILLIPGALRTLSFNIQNSLKSRLYNLPLHLERLKVTEVRKHTRVAKKLWHKNWWARISTRFVWWWTAGPPKPTELSHDSDNYVWTEILKLLIWKYFCC
jgi:hypothetical protein